MKGYGDWYIVNPNWTEEEMKGRIFGPFVTRREARGFLFRQRDRAVSGALRHPENSYMVVSSHSPAVDFPLSGGYAWKDEVE